jgi:diguanylate cyclase (GGDEF)-like protein
MKNTAIWSDVPGSSAPADNATHWFRIMGFISSLINRDKGTEMADLRARIAALAQENLQLKYQLDAGTEPAELARLAFSDCLTGLANRRALQCAAGCEIARMRRTGRPSCVALMDIDHFKAVNDDFGHAQGDAVLRLIAATLKAQTRATDTLARWGGEEFALFLPETDLAAAGIVAEKCRQAVQILACLIPRQVTITVGVSQILTDQAIEAAIARADAALYQGKISGRNRVVLCK